MIEQIEKIIREKTSEDAWWNTSEKQVAKRYRPIFSLENIDNLTRDDFKSFLLIKNNLHWEGIHRRGNLVTSDMDALKQFLKYVLTDVQPIEKRLNTGFIEDGGYWVKGIGRAIITAILVVVYPQKYGVWNAKTEEALKKLKVFPDFQRNDKFGDKYKKINNVLLEIASTFNISLWQLDGVFGEIAGASPFVNKEEANEEQIEYEFREHGIIDPVVFGMEKHLEDFLITNWNKTVFGNNYELIYGEGNELLSQQYPTDVGTIDILAKSRDNKEYLVIELKKGKSSDTVVGQTLRYITWVKRHLGKSMKVSGAIIVLDADLKLKYSLYDQQGISLYTYRVSFNLTEEISFRIEVGWIGDLPFGRQ